MSTETWLLDTHLYVIVLNVHRDMVVRHTHLYVIVLNVYRDVVVRHTLTRECVECPQRHGC